jgi:hypothetical protein
MSGVRSLLLLLAACCLLAASASCASPNGSSGDYYGRGSIHRDSFPPGHPVSRGYRYGRPARY